MNDKFDKFIDWKDKHPIVDTIFSHYVRCKRKLYLFSEPRYKLQKEHKQAGFTKKDRPLKKYDVWNASDTLAWVSYPILIRFRRNQTGYPSRLENADQWHIILDKMIYAFYHIIIGNPSYEDKAQEIQDKIEEGLDLYRIWFFYLWD